MRQEIKFYLVPSESAVFRFDAVRDERPGLFRIHVNEFSSLIAEGVPCYMEFHDKSRIGGVIGKVCQNDQFLLLECRSQNAAALQPLTVQAG
jgi:hypothetical protein